LNCCTDDAVRNQHASGSCSSGCHANPDALIRQLCFDSFHASASYDDVISAGSGSANGEERAELRRRDVTELQRLPLVDLQLNAAVNSQSRDQLVHDVTAD